MQISVMVRGYSTETLRAFLGIASEMGLPISAVRSSPMGLFIPVELAVKAGLIEGVPCEEPKPKRTRSRGKAEPAQEQLWEE